MISIQTNSATLLKPNLACDRYPPLPSPTPSPPVQNCPSPVALRLGVLGLLTGTTRRKEHDGVLARDLPSGFFLVELLPDSSRDAHDDVRLDGSEGADGGRTRFRRERADSNGEGSVERGVAVVSEFAVVEVALEDDEVRLGEVLEEIGRLGMEVPLGQVLVRFKLGADVAAVVRKQEGAEYSAGRVQWNAVE